MAINDDEDFERYLEGLSPEPWKAPLQTWGSGQDEEIAEVTVDAEPTPNSPNPPAPAVKISANKYIPGLNQLQDQVDRKNVVMDAQTRDQLVQDVQDADTSVLGNLFSSLAGLGAGVARRDFGQAYKIAKDASMGGTERALKEFDNQTQLNRQKRDDARSETVFKRGERDDADKQRYLKEIRDPSSERSQFAQFVLSKMMGDRVQGVDLTKLTAERIAERFPQINELIENEYKKAKDAQAREQHLEDKRQQASQFNISQDRMDDRNAASNASRERAAAIAAGQKIIGSNQLSDSQVKEYSDRRAALQRVKDVSAKFEAHPEWIDTLRSNLPPQSEEEKQARDDLLKAKTDYQFSRFGGTTTKAQEAIVNKSYPTVGAITIDNLLGDPVVNFRGSMNSAIADAERDLQTYGDTILQGQGKNNPLTTPGASIPSLSNPPAAPKKPTSPAPKPSTTAAQQPDTTKEQFKAAKIGDPIYKGGKKYKKIAEDKAPVPWE